MESPPRLELRVAMWLLRMALGSKIILIPRMKLIHRKNAKVLESELL